MRRIRTLSLLTVLLGTLAATVALAQDAQDTPGAWDPPESGDAFGPPPGHGPGGTLGEAIRLHMELGRYYVLSGDYASAQEHFLAVVALAPDAPAATARPRAQRMAVGAQARGYLMAAVTSELLGDRDAAVAYAESGLALLPADDDSAAPAPDCDGTGPCAGNPGDARPRGRGDRGHHGRFGRAGRGGGQGGRADLRPALERFLEDPAAFAAPFAGGVTELESRVMALEAELSENGAQ